jgi:peptidoglycan/LPS O-acetylase OafA/YrhL
MSRATDEGPVLNGYVPALDGVRGLAILVVMLGHFAIGFFPLNGVDSAVKVLVQSGWAGVDIFFVLSGFLITGILLEAKGSSHYFRNFYARRVLRIFPAYYAFLFIFFIVAPRITPAALNWPFDSWKTSQWWFWGYASNLQILFPSWVRPLPLSHFWSLAVEEQFYLFWPAVVLISSRKSLIRTCIAFLIGCVVLRIWLHSTGIDTTAGYRITPARLDTLGMGALLAVLVRDPRMWARIRRMPVIAMGIALTGVTLLSIPEGGMLQGGFGMQAAGYTLLAMLGAALIVISIDPARARSPLHWFLRSRTMRFLGKYSYAMYIIHFPLDWVLENTGHGVARFPVMFGSRLPAYAMFALFASAITAILALASWNLFEKHFLHLKRFFPRAEEERGHSEATVIPAERTVSSSL